MIPKKLKRGDEIRVVSPAVSLGVIPEDQRQTSIERFKKLGLKVSFATHATELDDRQSSSIVSRVDDIHEAFRDPNVKAVITTLGGFNSNQILRDLDYDLIGSNPKVFCGYSDISALHNAIYTKTELVTYYGPHFLTFGMLKGNDYTMDHFKKCLMETGPIEIGTSEHWSDDLWFLDQENREFHKNEGYLVINEGEASGRLLGGHLGTLALTFGTEYMPDLTDSILFLEEDDTYRENTLPMFDRLLQSLIHQPNFSSVKGIVIGRFQKRCLVSDEKLIEIIKSKKELKSIPVIANVSFGHTSPIFTFPIGGQGRLTAHGEKVEIVITDH
jgi:muramoyltetrapeptide carboxypeptidase